MGVFESFMALMEEAAITDRERKGRARDMMKKYSPALFLMAGSAFIHVGRKGEMERHMAKSVKPRASDNRNPVALCRFMPSLSFLP